MNPRSNAGAVLVAILVTVFMLAPMPARAETVVTAYSAGTKVVGQDTNTWGTAADAPYAEVWTEVELESGWSRSQTRVTDGSGYFVIPLTYGANSPGTLTWRVGVEADGGPVYSDPFTLTRTLPDVTVTAYSAGEKPVGVPTNTWGTATGAPNQSVWTEVLLAGGWARSQVRTTDASGFFVIPLTYGYNTAGTHTWRVGVSTPAGSVYSPTFTLARVVTINAQSARYKQVGEVANTWGTAEGAPNTTVWSEVRLSSGWARSQVRTTDSRGYFVIPLTYGINSPGTYEWRVGVGLSGQTFYSAPFLLTREAVYYANCTEVRAAGAAPIYSWQPGYGPHLDSDGDGVGCEV